jgi:glycerophosphoryl diester phosphodiesterase
MLSLVFFACHARPSANGPTREFAAVEHADDAVTAPDFIDIQGHRGARGLRPEETLPSVEAALDLEVDTLEFDLHLTRDDRLVVWHDPYIDVAKCRASEAVESASPPTATRYPSLSSPVRRRRGVVDPDALPVMHPALAIRNRDAAELRDLRCDRNPDPRRFPRQIAGPGELAGDDWGIVTLEELFDFVQRYAASDRKTKGQRENASTVRFNIETKRRARYPSLIGDGFDGVNPGVFEREFVRIVREHALLDRVTLQSFDHRSLWAAHTLEPALQLAVLEKRTAAGERDDGTAFATWRERGATVWSPDHRLVDAESLSAAHEAGLEVVPWTVNDTPRMGKLIELGVDGIITDRPDLIRH